MVARRPRATISAGDTFLVAQPYNHLYVVCSNTAADQSRVVLVSFTTFKPKEETCCMVQPGEHAFVKRRTCVRYKDARIATVSDLLVLVDKQLMQKRDPVSADLLDRIRKGAAQSDYLPEECRKVLQDQKLI